MIKSSLGHEILTFCWGGDVYRIKFIIPFLVDILLTVGIILGMAYAGPSHLNSTIIFVDKDAIGTSTGLDWTNAYTNLQDALTVAISGTQIWVAEGVYYPDEGASQINDSVTSTFVLTDGVALYGGFIGVETSFDERDWEMHITVLSGDLEQNDITDPNGVTTTTENITGTNAFHVIYSTSVTETAIVDGFTITAGQANGSGYDDRGGGMVNNQSNPTLTNLTFIGNSARDGAGMHNYQSSPLLTNVDFSRNSAVSSGGGMANYSNSNPVLTNVTFSGNIRGGCSIT
jgi:hypothetical protein